MSKLPTLVFIPGSWHKPTCYTKITKILQERHGLKCISITLPSTTGNPNATFKDDLDAAREAISNEINHGNNVVVVAHSYGGMVGNSAVKDFTKLPDTEISQTPITGHVIGLILIASGFTITGVAFMDPFLGRPPPYWRVNNSTGYAELVSSPRDLFYHDLSPNEAEYWSSQLTTQSLKALFEGGEFAYAGWMDVPVWYIGTIEDHGLPVAVQRIGVGVARELSASVEHRELPTSHSPFLSKPEETAGIVLEAIEAFTGTPLENTIDRRARERDMILPEARLWYPLTWFRFGLPLGLGHVLGKCFIIFRWCKRLWSFK